MTYQKLLINFLFVFNFLFFTACGVGQLDNPNLKDIVFSNLLTAKINSSKRLLKTNEEVKFFLNNYAFRYQSVFGMPDIISYKWDINCDNIIEASTEVDEYIYTFSEEGEYNICVEFDFIVSKSKSKTIWSSTLRNADLKIIVNNILSPANLVLSSVNGFNFGEVLVGLNKTHSYTLTNSGQVLASDLLFNELSGSFSISSNTCTSSLNVNETCMFSITFRPNANNLGNQSSILKITYNDAIENKEIINNLSGFSKNPALLVINGDSNFGNLIIGSDPIIKTYNVLNTGAHPATINEIILSNVQLIDSEPFRLDGGTCFSLNTLNPDNQCTIKVKFDTNVAGVHSTNIKVFYNNGVLSNTSVSKSITGTAINPANISINPATPFAYSNTAVGSSLDQNFTIRNNGGVATQISISPPSGAFSVVTAGTTCLHNMTLNASSNCTYKIKFSPSAAQAYNGSFTISSSNQTLVHVLSGTGIAAANIVIAPASPYTYSNTIVGSSVVQTFSITNNGGVATQISSIQEPQLPFSVESGTTCAFSYTLNPGSSCVYKVKFSPTQAQNYIGSFTISTSTQSFLHNLVGTGIAPANIVITPASPYIYPDTSVGNSNIQDFIFKNTGGVLTQISTISELSAPFSVEAGTTCANSYTLNPGSTCTYRVKFTPSLAQYYTSSFMVNTSSQSITHIISGTGVAAAQANIVIEPVGNYGDLTVNTNSDLTFIIKNTGGASATIVNISAPQVPFTTISNTCDTNFILQPNQANSCSYGVRFTPTASQAYSSSFALNLSGGRSKAHLLSGNGIAPAQANLIVTPTIYNYGDLTVGSSAEYDFIVSNTGAALASGLQANITGSTYFTLKSGNYSGKCDTSLAAGATCKYTVIYNPAAIGNHYGILGLTYNAGALNTYISGKGITPLQANLLINPSSYDYGSKAIGSNTEKEFTITNNGTAQATAINPSTIGSSFFSLKTGSYTNKCGDTLAISGTCKLRVIYNPQNTGYHSGALQVSYNAGSISSSLIGTGLSNAADILSFNIIFPNQCIVNNATISGTNITVNLPATCQDNLILIPDIIYSANASIVPNPFSIPTNFTSPKSYTITSQSGTIVKTYQVTVIPPLSNKNFISSFSLLGVEGDINNTNSTIFINPPIGCNNYYLTPEISISPYASINPLANQTRNFKTPLTYTVTAQNGDQKTYTVTVTPSEPSIGYQNVFSADDIEFNITYIPANIPFPTGQNDDGQSIIQQPYCIAETELTYRLWYVVRTWAQSNGYSFANLGNPGGLEPAGQALNANNVNLPVTNINRRDAIVFTNALTEWFNFKHGTSFSPVYYTNSTYTSVLKTSTNTEEYIETDHLKIKPDSSGFKLLSEDEWEFAARYRDDNINSVYNSNFNAYPYFTTGNSASGAETCASTANCENALIITQQYARIAEGPNANPVNVKSRYENQLNLYDMSGNVRELVINNDDLIYTYTRARGGRIKDNLSLAAISPFDPPYVNPWDTDIRTGFRIARKSNIINSSTFNLLGQFCTSGSNQTCKYNVQSQNTYSCNCQNNTWVINNNQVCSRSELGGGKFNRYWCEDSRYCSSEASNTKCQTHQCNNDSDCVLNAYNKPKCKTSSNPKVCVQCLNDTHCSINQICNNNSCQNYIPPTGIQLQTSCTGYGNHDNCYYTAYPNQNNYACKCIEGQWLIDVCQTCNPNLPDACWNSVCNATTFICEPTQGQQCANQ